MTPKRFLLWLSRARARDLALRSQVILNQATLSPGAAADLRARAAEANRVLQWLLGLGATYCAAGLLNPSDIWPAGGFGSYPWDSQQPWGGQ